MLPKKDFVIARGRAAPLFEDLKSCRRFAAGFSSKAENLVACAASRQGMRQFVKVFPNMAAIESNRKVFRLRNPLAPRRENAPDCRSIRPSRFLSARRPCAKHAKNGIGISSLTMSFAEMGLTLTPNFDALRITRNVHGVNGRKNQSDCLPADKPRIDQREGAEGRSNRPHSCPAL